MTRRNIVTTVAYVAVLLELATYFAHDSGRLREGPLYWTLLYASSFSLLGAVVWLYLEQRSRR